MVNQVKSKDRVAEHGEVFTNEREVNAMLDLVKQETERIDSRFLEPACGEGAFLKEILRRKLEVARRESKNKAYDYEIKSIQALTSVYGIDILEDNTEICRQNLYNIWNTEYTKHAKKQANDRCREIAKFILKKNIICGDALNLRTLTGEPIIFAEWVFNSSDTVKRRDFKLNDLLEAEEEQISIFMLEWEFDEDIQKYIPKPIKEYPPTYYMRLNDYE